MPYTPPTLDCQQCGQTLRTLSEAEAKQVAARPYNFIAYCPECRKTLW